MSDFNEVKVGDPLLVHASWKRDGEPLTGTVSRVGRLLFDVDYGYGKPETFRKENGRLNDKQFGFGTWVETFEDRDERVRRSNLLDVLKNLGFQPVFGSRREEFSLETLIKVIEVLEEDKRESS